MDVIWALLLFAGGFVSGGLSAIAGGSSFLTFPLLIATGLSPLVANITNFIALIPSNIVALAAYRDELRDLRPQLPAHLAVGLAGGITGSCLLIWSGEARFEALVPWLMLTATVFFAAGTILRKRLGDNSSTSASRRRVYFVFEFILMVYGGYFGAGIGIVLLACLIIIVPGGLHTANALKNAIIALMSLASAAIYIASGHIAWAHAGIMITGTTVGGFLSIRFIKKVPETVVRFGVLAWAVVLTIWTFWRYG